MMQMAAGFRFPTGGPSRDVVAIESTLMQLAKQVVSVLGSRHHSSFSCLAAYERSIRIGRKDRSKVKV